MKTKIMDPGGLALTHLLEHFQLEPGCLLVKRSQRYRWGICVAGPRFGETVHFRDGIHPVTFQQGHHHYVVISVKDIWT